MNPRRIFELLLLASCLSLISACGTFEIGIERTPTEATATLPATSTALPAARSDLSATSTTTATPTSAPTAIPSPSVTGTAIPPSPTSTTRPLPRPTRTSTSLPTPTPTATSALTVTSFTISPLHVYSGDPVTLTWTTIGAESVSINRLDYKGRFADVGIPVSATGSLTYNVPSGDRTYTFVLFATAGGASVGATVKAEVICTTTWFFANPPAGCPTEPQSTQMIAERFEHGLMIWAKSLWSPDSNAIYILYNDTQSPRWDARPDAWSAGQLESDPGIVPPAGFYQPVRGFGLIWRDTSAAEGTRVRDRLGWAIEPEFGLTNAAYQCDGAVYSTCYLSGPGNQVYVLQPERSGWFVWTSPTPTPVP